MSNANLSSPLSLQFVVRSFLPLPLFLSLFFKYPPYLLSIPLSRTPLPLPLLNNQTSYPPSFPSTPSDHKHCRNLQPLPPAYHCRHDTTIGPNITVTDNSHQITSYDVTFSQVISCKVPMVTSRRTKQSSSSGWSGKRENE